MAIGIENQNNINPADSSYPNGSIRDKTASLPGTPVDKRVYDDIHQFFAKLLRITPSTSNSNIASGLPENEYSGFQYIDALMDLFGRNRRLLIKDGIIQTDVVESDYQTIVIARKTAQNGHIVSMEQPTGSNKGKIFIHNYSPYPISVFDTGLNTINSLPAPYILPSGVSIEFLFATANWSITDLYKLDL